MLPELSLGTFSVNAYASLYVAGALAAFALVRRELARNGYPSSAAWTITAAALVAGAVGAKLYYFVEGWDELDLSARLLFEVSGSGWYGGFLLGIAAAAGTIRAMRLPVRRTLDLVVPGVALGQVFGRVGCFLGGCCHGVPSELPWAMSFPAGLYSPGVRVHPTQLYEASLYAIVFAVLWARRKRRPEAGAQLGTYLVLASGGRFLVEILRENPKVLLGLTAPHVIALGLALLGAWLLVAAARERGCDAVDAGPEARRLARGAAGR